MIKRITAFLISFCLIFEQTGFAQVAIPMGIPAYLCSLSPVADKFRPVHLRSLELSSGNGNFELILDKGDLKDIQPRQLEETTQELYRYFQVGLALPNKYFWVNLRPDSPDEVIEPLLEKTDVGRIMIASDLQLKKDLANFTSPQTPEGKLYWNKLYAKASELYNQQDIEIPTLTRPWIVPGEVIIRSSEKGAFVYKATLKVMLEQDYIKDSPDYNFNDPRQKELNSYSSELIRELIIPKLTREVNSSRRYAQLRQVYYSLILAQWFKNKSQVKNIDNQDLTGLTSKTNWSKDTYYQAYRKSFQKGEYNKQEQVSSASGLSIRQYFSGGIVMMSKPVAEWTVIPSGVTEFFAANQQYFTRLTIDPQTRDVAKLPSSPVLTDGGQKSTTSSVEADKDIAVSAQKKAGRLGDILQKVKDYEQYLFPAVGVGAAVFVYSISPSLLLWLIPVGVAAVVIIGAELASLEYRNIKKTDPDLLLIARGNPLSLTSGVQLLALGLDGIFDMREVRRSPSKFFINLTRVMYALPTGFIWTAMELAIDYFNGLRRNENILKPKLDMMRFAIRHSSGINPRKVMYLLFTQWCFAKDDIERRFMLYETALLHVRSSSDLAAAKEDTFQNNTFLASEAAFYHMLKQLKLEEFDGTLGKLKSGDNILYKRSQIKKDNISSDDLINLYLAERNRLWQVRKDRGLTEQDNALIAFLSKPEHFAASEYPNMPYYSFVVLKLLDRHFNDYFSANELLGTPKDNKLLEMGHLTNEEVIKGLVEARIVIANGDEYFLSENFKQNFRQFLAAHYGEISEAELSQVPEYEGALHVDGKFYRWAQNVASPQRDGGEIPVIAPAVVDMQAIEKEADRSVLEEEALEAAAGFGIDIEPELLTGPELIEWSARKQAIRQQVYATAGAAARFIPTDATTNELLFFLEEFSNGLLVSSQEEKTAGVLSRRFQAAAALICLALPVLLSGGFVSALADVAPTGGLNVSPVAVFDHLNHQDQSLLVVVNSSVEQYIDEDLEQYTRDLNNEGYKVTIVNSRGIETPEELRRLLQDEHAQGNADMVFFVGKLPVAQYLAPDQKDRVFDIQRINKLISLRDQLNTLTAGKDLSGLVMYSVYQDRIKEWPGYKKSLIKAGTDQQRIDEIEERMAVAKVWVDQHQTPLGEVHENYLEYDDLLYQETINGNVPGYLEENNLTVESLYPNMFDELERVTHADLVEAFSHPKFNPVDFYYTDLNGRFVNYNNRTGFFRNYTPADSVVELGLGRIDASGFSQGDLAREIKLYKDYFRRNHAYRLGYYGSPKRGLFFVNKDWAFLAEKTYRYSDIGLVYRDTTAISAPSEVNAENYLDQIQSNKYTWVTLYSHSDPNRHTFNYDNSEVKSPMIRNASAYFYWLYACSAVRYTEEQFIGGQYLFGDNNQGLAVIGSTYPSAFQAGAGFFSPLAEGNSLGQAYMRWVETENVLTEPINIKNDFGVAIIGDPTLVPYSRTEAQYDKLEKLLNDPREVFLWSLIPANGVLLAYLAKRIATDLTKEKKEKEDSEMPGQQQRDGGNQQGLIDQERASLLEVYEARKSALIEEYKRRLGWGLEIGLEQQVDPSFEIDPAKFLTKWQKAMQDLAALEDGLRQAYQYKSRGDPYSSTKPEEEQLQPVQEAKSPLLESILTRLPGVSLTVLLLFGFGIISGGIAHVTATPLYEQFTGSVQLQPYVLGINKDAVYPLSFHGSDEIFSPLGLQTSLEDPRNVKSLLEKGEQDQDSGSYKMVTELLLKLEINKAELNEIFSASPTAIEKPRTDVVFEKTDSYPQNESVLIFVDPSVVNIYDGIAAELTREFQQSNNSVEFYGSRNRAADQMQEHMLEILNQKHVDKIIFWDRSELSPGSHKINPTPDLSPVIEQKARIKDLVDRYDGNYSADKEEFDKLMNKAVNQNITWEEGARMHDLDAKLSVIRGQLHRFSTLINEKADNGELYDYLIEGNDVDALFPDIYEQINRVSVGHRLLLRDSIYSITPKSVPEKQAPKIFTPLQVNQSSFDTFQRVVEVKAQLDNALAAYPDKHDGRTFEQDYEFARRPLSVSEEPGKDVYTILALKSEMNSLGYENLFLVQTQDGKILQKEDVERIYGDYRAYRDYVVGQYQDPALVKILLWIYFIDPELANGIMDKEVKFTFTDNFIVLLPVPGFHPVGQAVPPLVAGPDGEIRLLPLYQETAAKDPIIETAAHEIFHNIQQQEGIPQLLSYIANPLPEENQARIRGEEDEHILNILPFEMRAYYSGRMDDLDPEHVVFLHKRIQDIDRQAIRSRIPADLDLDTKLDYLLTVWGPTAIFISSVGLGLLGLKRGLRYRSPEELMVRIKEIAQEMKSPETTREEVQIERKEAMESAWGFSGRKDIEYTMAVEWPLFNINSIVPLLRGGSVLDIGSGTGDLDLLLALEGHHTVGLDLSAEQVARAREKRKQMAELQVGDKIYDDKPLIKKDSAYFLKFAMVEPYRHFNRPGLDYMLSDHFYSAETVAEASERLVFLPGNFEEKIVVKELQKQFKTFDNLVVASTQRYIHPLYLLESANSLLSTNGRLVMQISDINAFDLEAIISKSGMGDWSSEWLLQDFKQAKKLPEVRYVSFFELAKAAGFEPVQELATAEDGAVYLVFEKQRDYVDQPVNDLYELGVPGDQYIEFFKRKNWLRIGSMVQKSLEPLDPVSAGDFKTYMEEKASKIDEILSKPDLLDKWMDAVGISFSLYSAGYYRDVFRQQIWDKQKALGLMDEGKGQRDGGNAEFTFGLSGYPGKSKYERDNAKALKGFFTGQQAWIKEHINKRVFSLLENKFGATLQDKIKIDKVSATFEKSGMIKAIFKISVQLAFSDTVSPEDKKQLMDSGIPESLDICLVALKPSLYAGQDVAHEGFLAEQYAKSFAEEMQKKLEFISKAPAAGVVKTLVPQQYDDKVMSAGGISYYLQEWIDGPSIAEKKEKGPLTNKEVSDIAEAWMSVKKVLGVFVGDPHDENIMFRRDGTPAIIDLGLTRDFNDWFKPRQIVEQLVWEYNPFKLPEERVVFMSGLAQRAEFADEVNQALFSGIIKGLGYDEGTKFLREAMKKFDAGVATQSLNTSLKSFLEKNSDQQHDGGEMLGSKISYVPEEIKEYDRSKGDEILNTFFSFSDFMNEALFNPVWGYYSSGKVRIKQDLLDEGHFRTFPESMSPYFGELVAKQVFNLWKQMKETGRIKPQDKFQVLEFGAGNGTLAYDMLSFLTRQPKIYPQDADWKEFVSQLRYVIGEKSDYLRKEKQLPRLAVFGDKVEILPADARSPEEFTKSSFKGVIVSNELPDAFGVERVRFDQRFLKDGFFEVCVSVPTLNRDILSQLGLAQEKIDGLERISSQYSRSFALPAGKDVVYLSAEDYKELVSALEHSQDQVLREQFERALRFKEIFVDGELAPEVQDYINKNKKVIFHRLENNSRPFIIPVNPASAEYIRSVAKILNAEDSFGYVLTIDYGGNSHEIVEESAADVSIRTFGDDEYKGKDYYVYAGYKDLTADVDATYLHLTGEEAGLTTVVFGHQGMLFDYRDPIGYQLMKQRQPLKVKKFLGRSEFFMLLQASRNIPAGERYSYPYYVKEWGKPRGAALDPQEMLFVRPDSADMKNQAFLDRLKEAGVNDPPAFVEQTLSTWAENNYELTRMLFSYYWDKPQLPGEIIRALDDFGFLQKGLEDFYNKADGGSAAKRDGGETLPDNDLGGIDFRELPVTGQPSLATVLMPQLQQLAANSQIKDLDREWSQIRGEMLAPEMPYNRIKEYIAVCLSRPGCRNKLDQAISCIIDILRMEEDQALATPAELKDILMSIG